MTAIAQGPRLQLPASTTMAEAAAVAAKLPAWAAQGESELLIDASALKVFDSATLSLLLQATRLAQSLGRPLKIEGLPEQLAQLARLYGVAELLSLPPAVASEASEATEDPAASALAT